MPPSTSTLLRFSRTARPAFRSSQANFFTSQACRTRFQFQSQFRQNAGKRWQSTTAESAEGHSWFKRMWDSPIGLKTVHFWAPIMKWALVIAGISDFYRPAEKLSLTQNAALTATGMIWTRWCLIIKPRNVLLAAVNFFLGIVGVIQVSRILAYNYRVKGEGPKVQAEAAKESVIESAKGLEKKVVEAVKKA
ncbi:Mitochondrial pyruvate carrier [Venustampulla echinocandica]|uniref:Mitochondrial pyruvate carrier n=1 Tax=Venustampulla echinocandica TaxID=2656787 RepID=A0A370TZR9_9HELO|nr:Mitochondrial pyruvate carrier [Venustampulla echinocandica]RDL41023.1 Mitochondrial pyruvate carrier [Venustampulla echinocandica]